MKLLLDTNFIVSYILPNDQLHSKSVELDEKYNIESKECYVSSNNNRSYEYLRSKGQC